MTPNDPPKTIAIDPRKLFVPSGIEIVPGARYRFTAHGQWRDWTKTVDADGWSSVLLQHFNRLPDVPFFTLCASVGADLGHAFAVGQSLDWTAPASVAELPDRQLYFFANDMAWMYWNNHPLRAGEGEPLTVAIERID